MEKIIYVILFTILNIPVYAQFNNLPCFKIASMGKKNIPLNNLCINKDTTIILNINEPIYGLTLSGTVNLSNMNGFARITVKDKYNYESLVYEINSILADNPNIIFNEIGKESVLLDAAEVSSLIIKIENSSLCLNNIHYTAIPNAKTAAYSSQFTEIKSLQDSIIIEKLNRNLEIKGMPWRAGKTSLSEKTYEEKKDMFGGSVPNLSGFDYYKDGIFIKAGIMPQSTGINTTSPYIEEFDWRNRHGKNWMTSVKNQGNCGSCWAFSACGTLEAYVNLYFNQLLNLDLSEQELVSCSKTNGCEGGNSGNAFSYIEKNGIVPEDCLPYSAIDNNCNDKCQSPSDRIYVNGHDYFSTYSKTEDDLKKEILKAPVNFGISSWNHVLVLAGYKTIQEGDRININQKNGEWLTVESGNPLIGKTVWLIKNSWGPNWGNNGYAYVLVDWSDIYITYTLKGNIHSSTYLDNDIICEDKDGDGYYFWGIGAKPSSCASWIPDEPDGDDSDADYGPMNQFGHLEKIELMTPLKINTTIQWDDYKYLRQNLIIESGGNLTISNKISMYKDAKVTVESGGTLTINGGVIERGDIIIKSGGKLIMKNNGTIIKQGNDTFMTEKGSIINIMFGKIL